MTHILKAATLKVMGDQPAENPPANPASPQTPVPEVPTTVAPEPANVVAAPMTSAAGGASLPTPEVVTASNGGVVSNKPWVVLGILVLCVIVGVLAAFVYFTFFTKPAPVEQAVVPSPTPVPSATVRPSPSPTLDQSLNQAQSELLGVEGGINAVNNALNDKPGSLTE